jgi:hypothetical protein
VTKEQAKEILSAWRPWANDAQSAEFADALSLCRQDAELAAWLNEHIAVQEMIRARFKQIPLPEGLKEQILSEHKSQKIVRLGQRHVSWYAMAASIALVVAVAAFWHVRPGGTKEDLGINGYRNRMVRSALRAYAMDLETNDDASVRSYLGGHNGHADYTLPKKLAQTRLVGCGVKNWQGKPVTMVCFHTGKPLAPNEKSDLFLFVVDREALKTWPEHDQLVMAKVNALATATWTEGNRIYLLATTDEAVLKELAVKPL